jgi:NAD(P)-dependent dehydrogenase (short-subunit alcohol dehydrogenase family)
MATDTVVVTGGSRFVGSHVILQLLDAGYVVRTTLRSLAEKADVVREMLRNAGADPAHLTFFAADLQRDNMPGCPRIYFGVVDVRDVADLHVRAMTHLEAAGDPALRTLVPLLDNTRRATAATADRMLGWRPRKPEMQSSRRRRV